MPVPAIETKCLSKRYGRSRGIDDVSLEVQEGDFFGFIGPNGAGKSTTIRVLLNLIFPTSGEARIFGMDVVKESRAIRRRLGYVPSEASLYDRMKVKEFLQFGAAFYGCSNSSERIRELSGLLELDLERKVNDLSTGNRKKVNIVQALVHRPGLLILDEPSAGLDPLIQSRLFDLLQEENRRGATVFFSSHILSEVQNLCRKVAIVREGRVIKSGEISTLAGRQMKKVRIVFADAADQPELSIPGMEAPVTGTPGIMEFLFTGDVNDLVSRLSGLRLKNLSIEDPPLEEVFLHYYETK